MIINVKKATYTDQQIVEAGIRLRSENKRVTPFSIRNLIGGGNAQRIKAIWEEYEKGNLDNPESLNLNELPNEVTESLDVAKASIDILAEQIYAKALATAEAKIKASFQGKIAQLKVELEQQIAENKQLKNRIKTLSKTS